MAFYVVNFKLLPHTRRETHDGYAYVVAPVVAVHVGVLNGQLLPAEEIRKSVTAWDGVPLPIGHPRENGQYISANRADILTRCVGTFRNPSFDGFSLSGGLWLNEQKARSLGGEALTALERIEKGEQLEVSTAYNVQSPDPAQGVYNGQAYDGIQRDIQPDHLALLLHETGACSWQDGCGAPRVNKKESPVKNVLTALKARFSRKTEEIQANIEHGFSEVRREMDDVCAMSEMTGNARVILPDGTIKEIPVQALLSIENGALLKDVPPQTEPADASPLGVTPSAPLTNATNDCDCPHTEQHANQEVQMDKKELVSNVLKAQGLAESERAKFEALPEAVLQKLATNSGATPTPEPAQPAPVPVVAPAATAPASPQTNGDALYFFRQFESMAANRRDRLTDQITANTDFTKEQCAALNLEQLDQLARNIAPQANYGGRVMPALSANAERRTGAPEPPPLVPPQQAA